MKALEYSFALLIVLAITASTISLAQSWYCQHQMIANNFKKTEFSLHRSKGFYPTQKCRNGQQFFLNLKGNYEFKK
ncbi:MAG: hypothetical protein COW00_11255 [Bdellovibrio sp. CG12_big_fil_rev_8_21_14_0_65_39_13]|nr:MAG: hypothetical protein COW78_16610 [Bdellovibrio sp. CG22_combo_CG10-13_8_21_14_all_39_27]PIQ59298.1 MAG: hypothetical protein COW00_11255 [Bdellovibrio sp. CG12_big_fil_rev_8_21_14_0_65_39_13]PIR32309.1 MAG: hypothetical protein COV37_20545 [Bdellovibrio sp. CG11_big_fil_rev_8_21_14_0_20_39_38]PJB52549.1 MAG: hypothetical protein CO099_12060 [Bdellovibrio sp. CG_4_9_14_3_um_filter_39_7]